MNEHTPIRLAVIGAGPGGYPAAFLAADLGMDVTSIDLEANPGGVCLYRGCIPSKTLLHVARFINELHEAADWGVKLPAPEIDLPQLRRWRDQVVAQLTDGLGVIRKRREVRFVHGRARFLDAHHLHVDLLAGGQQRVEFDYAIIATGSQPVRLPGTPDSPRLMTSNEALRLDDIPRSLLVIGGGYIGLELGTVYAALGSRVTLAERSTDLLSGVDRDMVDFLSRRLVVRFHSLLTETTVTAMADTPDGIRAHLSGVRVDQPEQTFDKVLVAIGRSPVTANLGLENTAVKLDAAGFVRVNAQRRTDEPSIYAVGDVAGQPMLAHKATYEARIAVQTIAGQPSAFEPHAIPAVVFTDPELAWCGLSDTDARKASQHVKVARFPWLASGRATTLDRNDGLTKLILDPVTDRVLGAGIAGVNAGELIAEATLAVEMGARAQDLMYTIHAHPTLAETMMEAAELHFGHSPNFYQRKRE